MSRKLSLGAALALAAVSAAITVSLTYDYAMKNFNAKMADVNERQAMYAKLSEIDQKARQEYIGTTDETALNDGICAGYLAGLGDAQAKYLSAEKYKEYREGTAQKNVGVGVKTLRDSDGNMEVIQVIPNSPAEKSGIKKGDTIISVDDKEVVRLTYADALNKLEGMAGSKVKLGILRGAGESVASSSVSSASSSVSSGASAPEAKAENLSVTVTRGEYVEQTVASSMINGNVAYLKISSFSDSNAQQFNTALAERIKAGAVGIIIDLRNNPGGSVKGMAAMLDTLLPAGNTVSYRDRSGDITVEYRSDSNAVNLPISVIVDRNTLGAAEIFAADIRDYKKGLLVGEKTAGDGRRSQVVPLSDGSAMILSVADYLTLNGKTFQGTGIDVDVNKALTDAQQTLYARGVLPGAEDPQLQAAVSALIRQGALVQTAPGTQEARQAVSSGTQAAAD